MEKNYTNQNSEIKLNTYWIPHILGYPIHSMYSTYSKLKSMFPMFPMYPIYPMYLNISLFPEIKNYISSNLLPKKSIVLNNGLKSFTSFMNVCICCRQKFACSFRLGVCPSCHHSLIQPISSNNKVLSQFKLFQNNKN